MDTRELKKLIKQGESASLEFKATTSQLKGAFETICGFLNGNGGIVLIGSKNNGDIVGQHVSDSTRQEIAREVKKIEPAAQGQIDIQFIQLRKKNLSFCSKCKKEIMRLTPMMDVHMSGFNLPRCECLSIAMISLSRIDFKLISLGRC